VFDRNNEIDAVDLQSGTGRQIVQNWTTIIKSPSVSPTGVDLAYQVNCSTGLTGEGDSIWTIPFSTTTNPCGGRRVTPLTAVGDDAHRPAWGAHDVFAYEQVDARTNVATIRLIARTPGAHPCTLTPGLADNRNPAWSP